MIQIGLPAGLQSVVFNISNVMVQSCVNSFGADVIAANTASANIAAFTYTAMNAVFHAAITFTSQNLGARRYDRIWKIFWNCQLTVMLIGVPLCVSEHRLRPAAAEHLCLRRRSGARRRDRNGHDPHIPCHDPLFPLRHHGGLLRHGARARKIVAADGRDDLRRLRDADRLDLHHFRVEAYASRPLCLLPHQLGHHRGHACRLLRLFLEAYPPEASSRPHAAAADIRKES
ncbi:MAG: MATE family efflux transporter [Acutalibacteraceae bacterium]